MITLQHFHYEIPDEVNNDKVHNSFIKVFTYEIKNVTDKGAQALKMFMKLLCTLSFFLT